MRRFGLIIANPGEAGGPNYCEGVNKDARNYLEFLCSPAGGAWERSEIQLLEKPSSLDVRVAMIQAKQLIMLLSYLPAMGTIQPSRDQRCFDFAPGLNSIRQI